MRILNILIAVVSLTGCAVGSLPKFPGIKTHYMVEVRNEVIPDVLIQAVVNPMDIAPMTTNEAVRCLEFSIETLHPYKIKFNSVKPMAECNLVGGYKPEDTTSLLNWIDDVYVWAEDRKKCLK